MGKSIAEQFEQDFNSVILENHRVVIGGATLSEALMRFETFEFCAETIIRSKAIGDFKPLKKSDLENLSHCGMALGIGFHITPRKWNCCSAIKWPHIVKRAYHQGLMVSSFGTILHPVSETSFLINPTSSNIREIEASDLVFVDGEHNEGHKEPTGDSHAPRDLQKP